MPYTPEVWLDRIVQNPRTFDVTNNPDGSITLTPKPGTITQAGTPINAAKLNNLEKQYSEAVNWVKSFGLGDVAKDIQGTDLNTLDVTGVYRGCNLTNSPLLGATVWFSIVHIKHSSTFKTQTAIGYAGNTSTNGNSYTRVCMDGVWTSWVKMASEAYALPRNGDAGSFVSNKNNVSTTGYATPNSGASLANYWSKVAQLRLTAQYENIDLHFEIIYTNDGSGRIRRLEGFARLKQQAAMGSAPVYSLIIKNADGVFYGHVKGVITSNSATETIMELYVQMPNTYTDAHFYPKEQSFNGKTTFYESQTLIATLPAGTQVDSVPLNTDVSQYKVTKTNKDVNGIFTQVDYNRKVGNSLAIRSVLGGGSSPNYTTRTITYYGADGANLYSEAFTLSYDSDGDLISEV